MVSIIIPVYNVEQYIEKCINSFINQTYKNIEVILVDDGSKDRSGTICDDYKEKDSRIIVIHKENGGQNSAVKAGLNIAGGNFVAFADSDDWVEPEYIKVMLDAMEHYNADMVCANGYMNDEKETVLHFHNCENRLYEETDIQSMIFPGLFARMDETGYRIAPSRCAKLFQKGILLKNIEFYLENVNLGEDSLLSFSYVLCCKRIVCIGDPIYHYRYNFNSTSHKYNEKNLQDLVFCVRQYGLITDRLTTFDFSWQISARKVEIVYRTLLEIVQNTNAANRKEMYRRFAQTIDTFDHYPVLPYPVNGRVKVFYYFIQKKQIFALWFLLILRKLYHLILKKNIEY